MLEESKEMYLSAVLVCMFCLWMGFQKMIFKNCQILIWKLMFLYLQYIWKI